MKLLICTQKVDANDPVLGFFVHWIEKLAERYELVTVVCLEKGEYDLPNNVRVVSLGKETGRSLLKYISRFFRYILGYRNNYDVVFVHMNQEYVLLGSIIWRVLGKKIMLWRNHAKGSLLTRIAVAFSHTVFCTSPQAFVAGYKKTSLMAVGIDTDFFKLAQGKMPEPNAILFLGRIAPVKNVDIFVDSLTFLKKEVPDFRVTVVGDALPKDAGYYATIKARATDAGLSNIVQFKPGVPSHDTLSYYQNHELYVNLTPPGSQDKTIFEAMATECLVLFAATTAHDVIPLQCVVQSIDPAQVAERIQYLLNLSPGEKKSLTEKLRAYVHDYHSLEKLTDDIFSCSLPGSFFTTSIE